MQNNRFSNALLPSLLLLASSALPACSSDEATPQSTSSTQSAPAQDPEQVTSTFMSAMMDDDRSTVLACLTSAAAKAFEGQAGFQMNGDDLESFELGAVTYDGELAEVSATTQQKGHEQEMLMLLRKENERWSIWGASIPIGDGSFTIDFERIDDELDSLGQQIGEGIGEAFAEGMQAAFSDFETNWEQGGSLEEIADERAFFESLHGISLEEHDAAWQVEVSSSGEALKTAATCIEALLEGTGLQADFGGYEEQIKREVELELSAVSRLEAIERVAGAVDLHPLWPSVNSNGWFGEDEPPTPTLTFGSGERPLPVSFVGPFLIEATELVENTPQPTGNLRLTLRSLGLAPGLARFQEDLWGLMQPGSLRDADGNALNDEGISYLSSPERFESYMTYSINMDMTGLLRGVEEIESTPGKIKLSLPTQVHAVSIAQADDSKDTDFGTLEIQGWGESTSLQIKGEDLEGLVVLRSPRRGDDSPLGMQHSSAFGWSNQIDITLSCPEAPAVVDLKICEVEELFYEFQLPAIALREFDQRPARLEALKFEGKAPISFQLNGPLTFENGMAQAPMSIRNHGNKEVQLVQVEFDYRDSAGTSLETFTQTMTGGYDFNAGRSLPLAPAHGTQEQEVHAAFAPEATTSIRFDVQLVEFCDGSTWEPSTK